MEQFPHLKFVQKITGAAKLPGGGSAAPQSNENKRNRQRHSDSLKNNTTNLKRSWVTKIEERAEQGLPMLDADVIPIFLKLNPSLLTPDFDLENFGIEVISEENEGFIIGASLDGLRALEQKIEDFLNTTHGSAKIADFWEIIEGNNEEWKPQHILSENLWERWNEINDEDIYHCDVGIAFAKPLGKEPDPNVRGYDTKLQRYRERLIERDELSREREESFTQFIRHYGTIESSFIDLEDSFSCRVKVTGKGLKDLVHNYPFVFEVVEVEEISGEMGDTDESNLVDLEILPPETNAPKIGVIDSGIMEEHRYLSHSINSSDSKSYVVGDTSTADKVTGGGHGTKVAGAILYPNGISSLGSSYQLPFFVQNLRILDNNNQLINRYPAALMKQIVEENDNCRVFNLSVNSRSPFRKKHMSSWAATIDSLSHQKRILFVISSGNVSKAMIKGYTNNGAEYPSYLQKPVCKLANPAQSMFGLIVGSVNRNDFEDASFKSLGSTNEISAFSRIGEGIWGSIKPDVVEYGGGLLVSKSTLNSVVEKEETSEELINSTLYGSPAVSKKSGVGTSYSTPKVSHIVGQLLKLYPDEDINLIRGLVAQGARLPKGFMRVPTIDSIKFYGYGIPSLERVTKNTEQRITFYNTGEISAKEGHLYSLKIPDELKNPADDFDILIEVTLTYTASVRRTRQKTKSYLSTWLDWTSSKLDDDFETFQNRSIKEIVANDSDSVSNSDSEGVIKWMIRERSDWGVIEGLIRNNSTLQKDWVIIKSNELPEELCFSVRGHNGWEKNKENIPYSFIVSIEAINSNLPIYEKISLENEIELESET